MRRLQNPCGIRASLLRRLITLALPLVSGLSAATEPVHLRMVVWDGNEGLPILRSAISDFMRAHPGVNVKLENVDYVTYFQKLLAQYAADVAPDVVMLDAGHFQAFARRGALNPLEPYYPLSPDFKLSDYYPGALKSDRLQGKLYILPRDVAPTGLIYYNKKAFDEAGVKYPDGNWTWDFKPRPELREKDFIWVMQQLTKKDAKGKVVRWGFCPAWVTSFSDTLTYSQGARYADNDEHPTKVFYNDPRTIRAYQFVADLSLKEQWMPPQAASQQNSILQASVLQLFASERIAMYQSGIWDAQNVRTRNKPGSKDFFDWDITLAPAFRDGTRAAGAGGSGYSMMSSTRNPKEAWELIQWMAGEHGMVPMAKAGIAQPAIRRLARSAAWIPGPDAPIEEQYPKNRIITDEAVAYSVIGPTVDFWPEINDLVGPRLDPIWLGTSSADTQLKIANEVAQKRIDSILRQKSLPPFNWKGGITFGAGVILAIFAWIYLPERRKRLARQEKAENRVGYLFLMPTILGLLLFSIGPMIDSLLMSFADWDIITDAKWRAVGNYGEAFFEDSRFWKSLYVTTLYTLMAVPTGVILSLLLAMLLNTKVRGIAFFRTCFYMPALASVVASSLIWRKVFQAEGGLANTIIYGPNGDGNLLGIGSMLSHFAGKSGPADWLGSEALALPSMAIMSLWGVGAGMIILLAGLKGVPQFYYEAATLDGASGWQRFRHITLPLIAPSLFFVCVTAVIGSFQAFTQAFVITQGGPNDSTRFYMYHLYEQAFRNLRMGYASALAWVLFLVILVLTFIQFRLNRNIYYEANLR